MIRIEDLADKYSDFRTLRSIYKRKHIEDALNYYEDNDNVSVEELNQQFRVFDELDCRVMIDCFQKESN